VTTHSIRSASTVPRERPDGEPDRQAAGASGSYRPASAALHVGHITPSSNSVLEPMVTAMQHALTTPVAHHFTRIRVERIALGDTEMAQFDLEPMLTAAALLADAPMDLLVWNGTSGSRSGLASDRHLCAEIQRQTGIAALTSTTALLDLLTEREISRYALAVPYTRDVSERIVSVYAEEGLACQGIADLGISENRDMAYLSPDVIRDLVRRADTRSADAILVICTGVAGAPLAAELERELGKPVIDSVAVTFWAILRALKLQADLPGWGAVLSGAWTA
jgi:maleate isomerase